MGKNDDMECDGNKLEHLVKKLIPYQHHPHFFRGLSQFPNNTRRIAENENTMYTYHKHGKTWKNTFRNTE